MKNTCHGGWLLRWPHPLRWGVQLRSASTNFDSLKYYDIINLTAALSGCPPHPGRCLFFVGCVLFAKGVREDRQLLGGVRRQGRKDGRSAVEQPGAGVGLFLESPLALT